MSPLLALLVLSEVLVAPALLVLLATVVIRHRRDQGMRARTERVEATLLSDLLHGTSTAAAMLAELPLRWRTKALTTLATSVGTSERATLRTIADECGVSALAHARLRSRRAVARVAALRAMTPLEIQDPGGIALLDDSRASVRGAAVWWMAIAYHDANAAARIAERADDGDPHVRHIVAEALIAGGATAAPTVARLLATGAPTAQRTALLAAVGLHDPEIADAARALRTDPDATVRATVARVLAGATTPSTHAALTALLEDVDPEVRAIAALCLSQGHRSKDALHIGPLLHDPVDSVRIAASRALLALGPIGELAVRATARTIADANTVHAA